MIEFIIIEEDEKVYLKIKNLIEKTLMNYDYNYKISNKVESNNSFKIYIINYSNKKTKDLLNNIRYEENDWSSMIIVITTQKLIKEVQDLKIMPIDIIEMDGQFEKSITRAITIGIRNYCNRPKTIKYKYKTVYYNIDLKDILYIEKEKESKRILIKTKDETYPYSSTLYDIEKKLDKRFIKCSRSYIINAEQVKQYNTKDNVITLKDGNCIYEISRDKKKDIINHLRYVD